VQASAANTLSGADVHPWHLKATFSLLDEQGKATDHGSYEEFWVSTHKYKRIMAGTGFTRTEFGAEAAPVITGTKNWPSPLFGSLLQAWVFPWPARAQIDRFDITAEHCEIDGAGYACFLMKTRPMPIGMPSNVVATQCFQPGSTFLRLTLYEKTTVKRDHPVNFQGRQLPGDIEVDRNGKVAMTAHLESIESLDPVDDALFVPPPDAVPLPIKQIREKGSPASGGMPVLPDGKVSIAPGIAAGLLLSKTAPVYPPIAKAARVQGTVVLQGLIGKDGTLKELHVISGPPLLQQAALDAVQQWVYRPYLLNNEPVEVLTSIYVVFTLGELPKPPPAAHAQP